MQHPSDSRSLIDALDEWRLEWRLRLRHRGGCYRWFDDGRCVDCGQHTGIPPNAVETVDSIGRACYSTRRDSQPSDLFHH